MEFSTSGPVGLLRPAMRTVKNSVSQRYAFSVQRVWVSRLTLGPMEKKLPGSDEALAQSVEHFPFKEVVPGSSPGRLTFLIAWSGTAGNAVGNAPFI